MGPASTKSQVQNHTKHFIQNNHTKTSLPQYRSPRNIPANPFQICAKKANTQTTSSPTTSSNFDDDSDLSFEILNNEENDVDETTADPAENDSDRDGNYLGETTAETPPIPTDSNENDLADMTDVSTPVRTEIGF